MLKQYVKIYVDVVTGEIEHMVTQDLPFAEGYEPIELGVSYNSEGFEIVVDSVDLDFGPGQKLLRAGELRQHLKLTEGVVGFKPEAPVELKTKVLSISPLKGVDELSVKQELSVDIVQKLESIGQAEGDLMLALKHPANTKVFELPAIQLIRIKKALGA